MNGEETTTIGQVAESQQNISNLNETTPSGSTEGTTQSVEAPVIQAEQTPQESSNATGTSSGVVQTAQTTEASGEDILNQVNEILNENKTLETVAQEADETQNQKENEAALNDIIKETTKDLPSDESSDVKAEATSSTEESDRLDAELKQGLEDIKDKKSAEEMAKKVYLAFQKERSMHQFDNEQNKNTIEVLKNMNKKLNEQVTTADNDPRVTKLDDEFYTLWRLEQSYKKDKSDASKKNLTRYYVAKLAVLNPSVNANNLMDIFTNAPLKSNTMGEGVPTAAPVAEVKQPAPTPSGIPLSKRGMF